jgi:hypothetical protein
MFDVPPWDIGRHTQRAFEAAFPKRRKSETPPPRPKQASGLIPLGILLEGACYETVNLEFPMDLSAVISGRLSAPLASQGRQSWPDAS